MTSPSSGAGGHQATIRTVLGEDSFLTREAIQSVLSGVEDIELVAECEDLDSLLPEAFATVLTERLMTYALGRGIEPSDMPVVRSIVKKAVPNNYRLSSIVMSIIESEPFQMRTRLESAEPTTRVAQSQERPVSVP